MSSLESEVKDPYFFVKDDIIEIPTLREVYQGKVRLRGVYTTISK